MAAIITVYKSKVGDLDSSLGRENSESVRVERCQEVEEAGSTCTSKLCLDLAGLDPLKALIPVC